MPRNILPSLFMDQSRDLIWMIDRELNLVYANASYQNLMIQSTGREKKIGESIITEGFGKGYVEKWEAYYHRALSGVPFEVEEHFLHPETGTIQYGQVIFNPVHDEGQEVTAVACQSRDITRIVRQRSEAHQLMDASLDVFCTIDGEGRFVFVSEAATGHWGYTPAELVGMAYSSLIVEEDIPKTSEIADAILGGREIRSFVNRYRRKDGSIACNQWSARWDGDAGLMYCVARDAREKMEQEALLQQSEQRFRDLVQEGSDLIAILDADGKYSYVSPTSITILGIHPGEFVGRSPFEYIHPDDVEQALSSLRSVSEHSRVRVDPFRFRNGNGEWRWIETVLTDMLDNPAVRGIVANSRDVTERMEEQQKLKLFEKVINSTSDAIIITEAEPLDEPGPRIVHVNEAFTRMTGYTPVEVIGKNPRLLQGPGSSREDLRELGGKLRKWEPAEITALNYTKSGDPFWVNFAVSPVAGPRGWFTHWISIQRDVTEQKTRERERELLTEIGLNFKRESDYHRACDGLCGAIGGFGGFDWVELWTLNIDGTRLRRMSLHPIAPDDESSERIVGPVSSLGRGEGLPGVVWLERRPVMRGPAEAGNGFSGTQAADRAGILYLLGIPLLNQGEVVGVLLVGSRRNAAHLEKHTSLFDQLQGFIGSEVTRKRLENNLVHLYRSIPDLVCITDLEGRFLDINRAGCELLGYTEEEILHCSFERFVFPPDREESVRELARLAAGESTVNFENRYLSGHGDIRWLSWTANVNLAEGLIYATARNITAEKKLRELNRTASQMARIGSWEVDLVRDRIFWSEMVHRLHGTDPDTYEPVLDRAVDFYREDFRPMVITAVNRCTESGVPFDFEAVIVTTAKRELWVRAIGNAEFIDGRCVRYYGSLQDIHERKEAELRLQSLADNLPGVVFQYHLHPDGTDGLRNVSRRAAEVWGHSAESSMEDNQLVWEGIRAGGGLDQVWQSIEDSVREGSRWSFRWNYVMPGGDIRRHWGLGSPSVLADGTVVFNSVILDITREARNEELLDEMSKIALIGTWETDLENGSQYKSPMVDAILGLAQGEPIPTMEDAIGFCRPEYHGILRSCLADCLTLGQPFDTEVIVVTAGKEEKWVRIIGSPRMMDGRCLKVYGSLQDITALKATETRLRHIASNLPGVIYQYILRADETDGVIYVAGDTLSLWGFSEDQVLGNVQLIWDRIEAAGSLREVQNSIRAAIQTKSQWSTRIRYSMPSGEVRTHMANGTPHFLSDGSVVFYSVVLDITGEARNEDILAQTAELAKIGSWEMNPRRRGGDGMYWSPMVRRILELEEDYNPSYTGGLELHVGESKSRIQSRMEALISEGRPFDEEVLVRTGRGREKWVRVIGQAERAGDRPVRIYGSFQDISGPKSLEMQIREILDSISDAFYAVDADWRFTYFNREAEKLLGKREGEVLGQGMWDVFPAARGTDLETIYRDVAVGGRSATFEYLYPGDDCWYEVSAYPSRGGLSVYFRNIDERKQATQRLNAAFEEKNRILESIGDAFFSVGSDWVVTYWNREAERVLGRARAEMVGRNLWEEYPDAVDTDFYRQYLRAMESGEMASFEEYYPALHKWLEVSAYPSGSGLSVYFKDVTLRKEADLRLLKAHEERYRILERITEAFVSLDNNWCYTYMNGKAGEIFGRDPDSMIGRHIWTEFPEGIGQPFHLAYQNAMATQQYIYLEEHYKPYDRWFENHIYPSPDGLSIFFRDVTERKRNEENLRMANERFEKVTEATNDAIWDWDIEGGNFFRSNAIDGFFGKGAARHMHERDFWKDSFHPEDVSRLEASIRQVLQNPGSTRWEQEYRILNDRNETVYVMDRGIILRNESGRPVRMVGAMSNITERKRHEQALVALNQSLNRQARELKRSNEELEQFAFVASHDLQEPLRMISSFMDLLQRRYGEQLDEKALQYIHFATDGARKMKQIILDLLEFSRANRPDEERRQVDLNEIITEYRQLRRKIIRDTGATVESSELPVLGTYRTLVAQVFNCLIDNAIKYSKKNEPPRVLISVADAGSEWRFTVEDNGIGIQPEFHEKIFIIFQRLHNRSDYPGTGIGLSIVKRSVEYMGGKVWLESTPGVGTAFYFTLPKNV